MKETLRQPNFLRDKIARPAGKLAAAATAGALAFGVGGCSAEQKPNILAIEEKPDIYEMSVDITCDGQSAYGMPEVLSYENDVTSPIHGKVDRVTIGCETRSMDSTSSTENDAQPANDIEVWKLTEEEQEGYVPKLVYGGVEDIDDYKRYNLHWAVEVDKSKKSQDAATEIPRVFAYTGNPVPNNAKSTTTVFEVIDKEGKINLQMDPENRDYKVTEDANNKKSYRLENPSPDAHFESPAESQM